MYDHVIRPEVLLNSDRLSTIAAELIVKYRLDEPTAKSVSDIVGNAAWLALQPLGVQNLVVPLFLDLLQCLCAGNTIKTQHGNRQYECSGILAGSFSAGIDQMM